MRAHSRAHTLTHTHLTPLSTFCFLFWRAWGIFKICIFHKIQSPFIHPHHLTSHPPLAHSKPGFNVDCRSSIGGGEERRLLTTSADPLREGPNPSGGTGGRNEGRQLTTGNGHEYKNSYTLFLSVYFYLCYSIFPYSPLLSRWVSRKRNR